MGMATFLFGILFQPEARAFTLHVVDDNGNPITTGFRWLVEQDNTFLATPGTANPSPGLPSSHTLGVNIHRSHSPVVKSGNTGPSSPGGRAVIDVDPSKRYFVSVLPWHTSPPGTPPSAQTGFTMSGADVAANQGNVTVVVHAFPVPTAQITVLAFHDNQPINAAFDMPAEVGLPGFTIILTDPVGQVMQDAWANPLGTTYQIQRDPGTGAPLKDASGNYIFILDGDGNPVVDYMGDGNLKTCPTGNAAYDAANCTDLDTGAPLGAGEAVVRFLNANKYTIEIVPPDNDPNWFLTGTLEGTRGNDAWVRAAEPRFNIALGQLNWLVFYGFVKAMDMTLPLNGDPGTTITGQVVYAHDVRPPLSPGLSPGPPLPECYVGLNNLSGADEQVYTAPCNADSTFSIPNVPPGSYQLAMWDTPINAIIDYRSIVVPPGGGTIDLGKVAVYGWFGTYIGSVFNDDGGGDPTKARNAFRDPGEMGIPNQLINLRFTDGSIYASTLTENDGSFNITQVFPWWRWIVAEIDGSRFKATGLTAVVDDGGDLPTTGDLAPYGAQGINPQIQPDGLPYRIEPGEIYTEPMMLFSDMTNRIDWGKSAYLPGENTSIAGVVYYATTRTEEDPQNAVADPWEPGIPRVKVHLYKAKQDDNGNWVPDGGILATYITDSFDDSNPTGCVGGPQIYNGIKIKDCAETFRTWDQIRPGVYDGAYFFSDVPPGDYIVQIIPPKGYEVLKWGDRNIEFGDPKIPFQAYPPQCVGPEYEIPQYHTLFPDQQVPTEGWSPGKTAPLCDMKLVQLAAGQNGAADFFLFTPVPKAGRIWGWVSDDLHLEFNPNSPNAAGNFAPSWLPVSLRDYKGVEVARVYTDQWGKFNALVPGNYDIAPPIPLGLALSMISIFPNDPGPILDKRVGSPTYGKYITDPWFNPAYGQEVIRENWEFYPGRTTFVDTIVIPISGFVENRIPLNCDYPDATPLINSVMGPSGGPYVQAAGDRITITSVGVIRVPNPDYNPNKPISATNPRYVNRRHGFGTTPGTVTVGGVPLTNVNWAVDGRTIRATVPASVKTGQLVVTRADNGVSTPIGVTLHVGDTNVIHVSPPPANCVGTACARIQPAIDMAPNGALILIAPGRYQENIILYKPVQLQGAGSASTIIDNTAAIANLQLKDTWNTKFQTLMNGGWIDVAPGAPTNFQFEQGAGIFVMSCDNVTGGGSGCPNGNEFTDTASASIDGLTITGANEQGGGIFINAFAPFTQISNNDIYANQGTLGGGIRIGTPSLLNTAGTGFESSHNENIKIEYNRIAQNGSLLDGSGGISLYTGSDSYMVTDNLICGCFSANYGGGIDHFGFSSEGLIANNLIVSNESFDEAGGIMIAGELAPAGAPPGTLTPGSGSVTVNANLIQGNKAGDDGGGLRTLMVNGQDVSLNPNDPTQWFEIKVFNNIIVNNSSADRGGGISIDDTLRMVAVNNTISNNDATSTSSDSFGGPCVPGSPPGQICPEEGEAIGGLINSIPQVGGIATYALSTGLQDASPLLGPNAFSNPTLYNNIIWQNRSFYWDATYCNNFGGLRPDVQGLCGAAELPHYWDLAVYNTPSNQLLSPTYSILTDGVGANPDGTNQIGADPLFVDPFLNLIEATSKGAALGNFVTVTFKPNGLRGNYHISKATSPAVEQGGSDYLSVFQELQTDYDRETRPSGSKVDIGADEFPLPSITLTSPNGGESWKRAMTHTITWTYTGAPGPIKIELLKGGIVQSVPSNSAPVGVNGKGSFKWNIPSTKPLGTDYSIRISSKANAAVTDTSDADFSIIKLYP